MFGLNKKNKKTSKSSKSAIMEMETMENDLAGKKPLRESVHLKNASTSKEKVVIPQKKEGRETITRSPFSENTERENTPLSERFLPKLEKSDDDTVLLSREQLSKEKSVNLHEEPVKNLFEKSETVVPINKEKNKESSPLEKSEKKTRLVNKNQPSQSKQKSSSKEVPTKTNWGMIIATIIIFIIAIFSGVYYYFFVLKQPINNTLTDVSVEEEAVEITNSSPNEQDEIIKILPTALKEADVTELQEQNILKTITTISNNELSDNDKEGKIFEVLNESGTLDAPLILDNLDISLPIEIISNLSRGWIFIRKLEGENLRVGLLFEIKNSISINDIRATIMTKEKELPENLDNLFIEDQIPIIEDLNIVFSKSLVDENFRYFNFYPDKDTPSIDWGVKTYEIDQQSGNLLIFSTSKKTTQIISDMLNY